MIEVDVMPLFGAQAFEVAVVRVVRDPFDLVAPDAIHDGASHGGLARPGAARDADDHWPRRHDISSYSASVAKSATSSLPHAAHMIDVIFPFVKSNWYVGVS